MEDAYTIGIRLLLEDSVSAGLATIQADLASVDQAIAATTGRLAGLRAVASQASGPQASGRSVAESASPAEAVSPNLPISPAIPPAAAAPIPARPAALLAQPTEKKPNSPPPLDAPRKMPAAETIIVSVAPPLQSVPAAPPPATRQSVAWPAAPEGRPREFGILKTRLPTTSQSQTVSSQPTVSHAPPFPQPLPVAVRPILSGAVADAVAVAPMAIAAASIPHVSPVAAAIPVAPATISPAAFSTPATHSPYKTAVAPVPSVPATAAPKALALSVASLPVFAPPGAPQPIIVSPTHVPPAAAPHAAQPLSMNPPSALQPAAIEAPRMAASPRPPTPPANHPELPERRQEAPDDIVSGDLYLDGARLGRWMRDHLSREINRPQAGTAAFDPTRSPSWPGALQNG